jgi:transcriptional regulator with XRE-family HTH domain
MSTNQNPTASDMSLRARRERAGLSRQQLGQLAGCSVSFVQLVETGFSPRVSPTRERIERVLAAFEAKQA